MGIWLSKLLSPDEKQTEAELDEQLALQTIVDIDVSFRDWLFNGYASSGIVNQSLEKSLMSMLSRLSETNAVITHLVPRMPTVLPELLVSLHDKNISNTHLSHLIGRDISLIAEVINDANSPYYLPTEKITSVDKAVLVLGNKGLRMTFAKAFMRPIINVQTGPLSKRVAPRVWEQSEKCAMACCILSSTFKTNPFEAFLSGLIKNLGMTLSLQLIDQLYTGKDSQHSPDFCKTVEDRAQNFSAYIARLWDMPDTVITAIEELSQSSSDLPNRSALGMTLLMGDRTSKLETLVAHGLVQESNSLATGFSEQEFFCYQKLKFNVNEAI